MIDSAVPSAAALPSSEIPRSAAGGGRWALARALRGVKFAALLAAVGAGSFLLLHPDPYSLTDFTRAAKAAGFDGAIAHLTAYAGLAALAAVLRPRTGRRADDGVWARRIDACAWPLFLAAHGIGTEAAQMFVPTRVADPWDVFFDLVGVACGWIAGQAWVARHSRRAAEAAS